RWRAGTTPALVTAWLLSLSSCDAAQTSSDPWDAGEPTAIDGGADAHEPARCRAPEGISPAPRTVADVVELLNALPRPVSLPCFLETLERPLAISATDSIFSLQPAEGTRSPRIFLHLDTLTLSVVPEGTGAPLLELAERRSPTTSLKAELAFPIEAPLSAASPYERLRFDDRLTNCGVCHQGESPAEDVNLPLAMLSQALRPRDDQRVPLERLRAEASSCDAAQEPERCALLDALFGPAPAPRDGAFPATYNTFF
ncbi:MAG TPA: hypothetical protein VFZ61_08250, partial [Polyangiales bacterium]